MAKKSAKAKHIAKRRAPERRSTDATPTEDMN